MLADPSLSPIIAVNKDEIRRVLGIKPGDFRREKEVERIEANRIADGIRSGSNIIVDNTHNSPKYFAKYKQLAQEHDYEFCPVEFDVSLEECIRRDALRPDAEYVGEAIIRRMYDQFYKK